MAATSHRGAVGGYPSPDGDVVTLIAKVSQRSQRATMTRGYPSSDAATVNPSDTILVFISNSSGDEYCDGNREDASICA